MPLSFGFSSSPRKAENPCLMSHDSSTEGCPTLFLYSFVWGHFGDLSFHFHPSTITVFKLILLKQKFRKERRTWGKTKKWDGDPLTLGVVFSFFFFSMLVIRLLGDKACKFISAPEIQTPQNYTPMEVGSLLE